MKDMMVE